MLDIKWIRDNQEEFVQKMKSRNFEIDVGHLLKLDSLHRMNLQMFEEAQSHSNKLASDIGQKKAAGEDTSVDLLRAASLSEALITRRSEVGKYQAALEYTLLEIPNVPFDEVPIGSSEADNVEVNRFGIPRQFDWQPKPHWEMSGFDFDAGIKLSGSRFTVLRGHVAQLERALTNFMVDLQTRENGFELVNVPYLVKDHALYGTGQLPKFKNDLYETTDGNWLIPTAEVPLTNLVRDTVLQSDDLPIRFCAVTPCFRKEAGSYGRDMKGMLRQHQFNKLELVSIVHPDRSKDELNHILASAQRVLELLEIPYRTVLLCTGDMGFSAAQTYDIEVWLPGENAYREISSCSNCGDFQARRMGTRFKDGKKKRLVHTLNGSGLAIGRLLIAVVENYQREDGSFDVPEALKPYLGQ